MSAAGGPEPAAERIGRLRQVILPVDSIETGCELLERLLGLQVSFKDGDRYAAFDTGSLTIALAAPAEQVAPGKVVLGVRVADVADAGDRLAQAGFELGAPEIGAHEVRLPFTDSSGNQFVAYAPLKPTANEP